MSTIMNTRDQIFSAIDQEREKVEVPEWGKGGVPLVLVVQGLSSGDRDLFEAGRVKWKNLGQKNQRAEPVANGRAALLVQCIVHENGEHVFSENDIERLGEKSAKVVERLVRVAQRLSGIKDEDMDEIEGNSGADRIGSTATPLQTDGEFPQNLS